MMLTLKQLSQIIQIVEPYGRPDYSLTGTRYFLLLALTPLPEDVVRQLAAFEPFVEIEPKTNRYVVVIRFEA